MKLLFYVHHQSIKNYQKYTYHVFFSAEPISYVSSVAGIICCTVVVPVNVGFVNIVALLSFVTLLRLKSSLTSLTDTPSIPSSVNTA